MLRLPFRRKWAAQAIWVMSLVLLPLSPSQAGEPPTSQYWDVKDVRPGMRGTGQTVMVGTKLEQFEATVLGVMRGVSPGRDMILCRLKGCDLEHAGIIQGMSGSPIYIDGKLLGAVAYAWEFAKDPIAGVTPFSQMVEYVRANDRRVAAEERDRVLARTTSMTLPPLIWDREKGEQAGVSALTTVQVARPAGGMMPIAVPLAASGFSPRAMAGLEKALGPMGMAPMAAGDVPEDVRVREARASLVPGAPLCVAMVSGDFDLSAIGTVTHVEGDRVYGFGHPMFSLGACAFPMMTGYIHTVYPRASVSMKMGSPLEVVGVLDTDVSTGISGRLGPAPDMMPMTVRVQTGRFAEPRTYHVQVARQPRMLSSLVMSVLTSAIDTEGDLPDELTARIDAHVAIKDHGVIEFKDVVSGPRFTGPTGPSALFGPVASIASIVSRNAFEALRIESIECNLDVTEGRSTAELEGIRLRRDRVAPGDSLEIAATVLPFQGAPHTLTLELPIPADMPEGTYDVSVCDAGSSLKRRSNNAPQFSEPRDIESLLGYLRVQGQLERSTLFAHVGLPERGLAIDGQALPSLPGSVRAVLSNSRETAPPVVRDDLVASLATSWVVEGSSSLKFQVDRKAPARLER